MDDETKTIKERLASLEELEIEKRSSKKFKLPFKAKLNKKKLKDGYVTIVTINDNKNIDFTRERIIDGTIKMPTKDLSFHAIDSKDIYFYKGKPIIFQPKRALNPYNPLETAHETYGQKYVMARMEGDKIALKKSFGMGIGIVVIIVIAIIAYAIFGGGGS